MRSAQNNVQAWHALDCTITLKKSTIITVEKYNRSNSLRNFSWITNNIEVTFNRGVNKVKTTTVQLIGLLSRRHLAKMGIKIEKSMTNLFANHHLKQM